MDVMFSSDGKNNHTDQHSDSGSDESFTPTEFITHKAAIMLQINAPILIPI
jgi:hypothetical protein